MSAATAGADGARSRSSQLPRRAVVTVPGKLILMGEHAAVYGRPAVVAALGLRTAVEIETTGVGGVELDLATLGHREITDWVAIDAYTRAYAERWRRFDRDPTRGAFARLADADPARVVKLALGETRRALGAGPGGGVRLRVVSEIPVGSGFGSSASVASAVAGALATICGALAAGEEQRGLALLSAIALEAERRQHGRPSGVDHAAVLRGGILRVEPAAGNADSGGRVVESIAAAAEALAELRVFDTGAPAETTGEVVAAVRTLERRDPAAFETVLDAMERATRRFAAALAPDGRRDDRLDAMRSFQRRLEELGVVPPPVRAAAREVERRGGAAKLSGAGTLSGSGAGALVVCWPAALAGAAGDALPGYPCHRAPIGAPGLRVEETE